MMKLKYKPDWEKTKENYIAWWAHEDFGRCAINIKAPKDGISYEEPPRLPEKLEDRWLDLDYLKELNEYRMGRAFYGGEAVPVWNAGYPGWDTISAFLGCDVELMEETGWVNTIIDKGEIVDYNYNDITLSQDNRWWVFAKELHRFAVDQAKGKAIPGIQAISGCGDILASLRGSENLLMDCTDYPEYVRKFDQHLMRIWMNTFDILYQITKDGAEGSTNFMHLWAPGKFYIPHCDFAYMISPKMFREIFLPSIQMQVEYLDYSLYHVDGIGNFPHVDALCEIPRLQAIQILPGDGKPSALYYMNILKKVQCAGKNLQIYVKADEVEAALENLSSLGLLLIVTDCQSEDQARYIIRTTEKYSKIRKI
ncbi:MAG: hypothetical protein A2Y21_04185 [Clostridiales bacterium GWC2_40_7]|nr:MAG: hypothetical protein A2Y21_04185 [Clostridiales bacterium GWC2_40_7]